jgi:hypothetical protein
MVVHQGIAEMELAGCRSRQLYFTASAYMEALTADVSQRLGLCSQQLDARKLEFTTQHVVENNLAKGACDILLQLPCRRVFVNMPVKPHLQVPWFRCC